MTTLCGADGGRSHGGGRADDSRGPTNGGGAGGGGARGGEGEPMKQGDEEDPEVQGGADGTGDRRGGVDPKGGARATEDQGGAEGMKEPDGAGGTKGRGAARGVESRGAGWSTPDQDGAGGMREPGGASGLPGHSGEEGARSHGGADGSTGRGGVQGLEAGGGSKGFSNHGDDGGWQTLGARTVMMVGWGRAEGLPDDSGGGGRSGREGGHLWASGLTGLPMGIEALSWQDSGTEVAEGSDEGGRRGGRSMRSPSAFHSPRSLNSSLSAKAQGVELLSALSLSAAISFVAGVVAGSRTWSDGKHSSRSAAIHSSIAPCGDGSSVAVGSGSLSSVGSGMRSAQRWDGGLDSGSGVVLVRSSSEQTVSGDPFLASIHSTKAVKSTRGPSSDYGTLHTGFRLAS